MTILRSIPRFRRGPSYRGRVMIDSIRGVLRVRKWPRKRGRPRSALQRFWVDWFVQANRLAKYADGMSQARAIEMTKGSGLYPRDVLLMAMRGRLYFWTTPDGWKWYSMAAIGDISESLDVLAQTVGDILVRAADRWRPPPPGIVGDIFTNQGPNNPPVWAAPAGAGAISVADLPGTPIVPDNTKNAYILDVKPYAEVYIDLDNIGFAASDQTHIRYSVDDGVSYKAGATDYLTTYLSKVDELLESDSKFKLNRAGGVSGHYCVATLRNLRAGRAVYTADMALTSSQVARRSGRVNFAGPITHVKVYSLSGNNFDAGTIRVVGMK